jgi:hypothetical protein
MRSQASSGDVPDAEPIDGELGPSFRKEAAPVTPFLFMGHYSPWTTSRYPLLMTEYVVAFGLLLAAAANATPSTVFVNPPTAEYFRGPPGNGFIKICKEDDQPDTKRMPVPMGTFLMTAQLANEQANRISGCLRSLRQNQLLLGPVRNVRLSRRALRSLARLRHIVK